MTDSSWGNPGRRPERGQPPHWFTDICTWLETRPVPSSFTQEVQVPSIVAVEVSQVCWKTPELSARPGSPRFTRVGAHVQVIAAEVSSPQALSPRRRRGLRRIPPLRRRQPQGPAPSAASARGPAPRLPGRRGGTCPGRRLHVQAVHGLQAGEGLLGHRSQGDPVLLHLRGSAGGGAGDANTVQVTKTLRLGGCSPFRP